MGSERGTRRTDRPALTTLRSLEGRRVGMALSDGTRIDDCQLVSGGHGVRRLWVYTNGQDIFVPCEEVVEVWEAA